MRTVGGDVSRSRGSRRTALFSLEDALLSSKMSKGPSLWASWIQGIGSRGVRLAVLITTVHQQGWEKPERSKGAFEFEEQGSGA